MLIFQGVTSTRWFCSETRIIRIIPESLRMFYQRDPVHHPGCCTHEVIQQIWSLGIPKGLPCFFHLLPIVSQGLQKEWYGSRVWEEITLGIGSPWISF